MNMENMAQAMRYSEIICGRILELCHERNITINVLAVRSGVSQSTIDNIIHHKSFSPQLHTLHKLANAFNMTPAEFLDFPALNNFSFDEE